MISVLRLFGYPVLTFGPESLVDEPERDYWIDSTGEALEIPGVALSLDYGDYVEDEYFTDKPFGYI